MRKLTVAGVKNAKAGRHADGDGLYLFVKPSGRRTWLLRIQVDGQRRDIGLGSVDLTSRPSDGPIDIPILHRKRLSLSEAREKCALLRKAAEAGLDPVVERDKGRRGIPTFKEAARLCHESIHTQWAPRQQAAFLSSLELHAMPALGGRRVNQIDAAEIAEALKPIWTTKPDIARKVKIRIGQVLNYAQAKKWRSDAAPRTAVTIALPKQPKGGNYAAMPYADVPTFMANLRAATETMGRLALQFTILTAARSGEVRNAQWSHVDLDKLTWTRPAALMKMRKDHTVQLCDGAIAILKHLRAASPDADDLIFPNRSGKPLSDATLSKIVRDMGLPYTVHGFRSSFRDWAAERMPHIPDSVAEVALAHAVNDKVVAAYKRTDFAALRRTLMAEWDLHCIDRTSTGQTVETGNGAKAPDPNDQGRSEDA